MKQDGSGGTEWDFWQGALRREFVYAAVFAGDDRQGEWDRYLHALELPRMPAAVALMQVDGPAATAAERELLVRRSRVVYENLSRMTAAGGRVLPAAPLGERDVLLLLPLAAAAGEREANAAARQFMSDVQCALQDQQAFSVTVAVGNAYPTDNRLHQSYQEARTALQYKFYHGDGQLIHIRDLDWETGSEQQRFFVDAETRVLEHLRNGDWDGALRQADELLAAIGRERRLPPDVLKVRILELLTVLSRAAMDLGVETEDLLTLKVRAGQEIAVIASLPELTSWLLRTVRMICERVGERQQEAAAKAVARAMQYIHTRYRHDVSLDELARAVHLSPFYLSRVFAERAGMPFVEYLKTVRIRQAQSLLLSSELTVAEIAERVGYNDPNYFSRVFRAVTGLSPSQYRRGGDHGDNSPPTEPWA